MRWVLGEAGRNLASGTTHALRYALALALVVATLAAAEAATVDSALRRAEEYRASGANVIMLQAPGLVDGAACDAISGLPGVEAAGALRSVPDPVVAAALPQGSIAGYRVTDGALDLFGVTGTGAGVAVSQEVADSLGLEPGDPLVTTAGTTAVRGTFPWPDDGRRFGFSYAALAPDRGDEPFDECWARAWPVPTNLASVLRLTVGAGGDESTQVTVGQLNTTHGTSFDGGRLYDERTTRPAPWIALGAGLVIGYVSVRTRRLELAAARHVGVGLGHQHVMVLAEAVVWVAAAAVLAAAAVTVLVSRSSGVDDAALAVVAARVGVSGVVGALLGTQLATAVTRESHLFRYFKAR